MSGDRRPAPTSPRCGLPVAAALVAGAIALLGLVAAAIAIGLLS